MKFLHILTLLLVALVSYTSAQRCPGGLHNPSCSGPRDVGHRRAPHCMPRNMYYYDSGSRSCRQMRYMGCGGNNNRWCTRNACRRRCRG